MKTKTLGASPFYRTKSLLRNKSISRRVQGGHYNEQGAFIPDGTPFQSESGECRVIQQTSHRNVPSDGCGTPKRSEVKNPSIRSEQTTPDYAALKDKMRTMDIVDVVDLETDVPHGSVTKIVTYSDGSKGVYKPEYGEDLGFVSHDVHGRMYAREAATSDIADAVKMDDLVPPTVVRDVHGQRGSVQQYRDNALPAAEYGGIYTGSRDPNHPRYDGDKDLARAGALDYLTAQSDRHLGNWLLDETGKLILIDNGGSFPNSANNTIGPSYLTDVARERNLAIPEEVKSWKWDDIHQILRFHKFSLEEIAHTEERFKDLQKSATFGELHSHMKARIKKDKEDELRARLRAMRVREPRTPEAPPEGRGLESSTNLDRGR